MATSNSSTRGRVKFPRGVRQERMIGDKAYDSDKLDERLAERRSEMVAPHLGHRKTKTQDGRQLRRYKRRWKVERIRAVICTC